MEFSNKISHEKAAPLAKPMLLIAFAIILNGFSENSFLPLYITKRRKYFRKPFQNNKQVIKNIYYECISV